MAATADPPHRGDATNPCSDRQSAGESCGAPAPRADAVDVTEHTSGHRAERLYLVQIAMLEAKVEALESRLEAKETDLQHVVDRYERVLQERDACRDRTLASREFERVELDDGDTTAADATRERTTDRATLADRSSGALDRLRALLK